MFRGLLPLVALAGLALGPCASAADLEAMSAYDKRIHCVAYGLIDVQMRFEAGGMDRATYDRERRQLAWKIQNRGDNFNYAPDFQKLDAAIGQIIAEKPPMEAFGRQVQACRGYLRL